MQKFISKIIPLLVLGLVIIVFLFGLMLFAYVLLFAVILGLALFIFSWVKAKLFPPKKTMKPPTKSSGRIIDTDDWKEL